MNVITLHLTTNDKAAKTATVEYDVDCNGATIKINGKPVEMDKVYYQRAYYGNCGNKLYLWTGDTVYLFTMTDGWAEMYAPSNKPLDYYEPLPVKIMLSIISLYDVTDCEQEE